MLKILKFIAFIFLMLAPVTSLNAAEVKELKVGTVPLPHAKVLQLIAPDLKKQGINLKIIEFNDNGLMPNIALNDGSIDANYFQHVPFYQSQAKDRNYDFINVGEVHIEPIALYSKKIKNLSELRKGAVIAVPSDPSNYARALILLHNNGVFTLKDPNNFTATKYDIVQNPKKIEIKTVDGPLLVRTLSDVDGAIINGNYAMQGGLTSKDVVVREDSKSKYGNCVFVRKGDENRPEIQALLKALRSDKVKKYLQETYKDSEVIPAF